MDTNYFCSEGLVRLMPFQALRLFKAYIATFEYADNTAHWNI